MMLYCGRLLTTFISDPPHLGHPRVFESIAATSPVGNPGRGSIEECRERQDETYIILLSQQINQGVLPSLSCADGLPFGSDCGTGGGPVRWKHGGASYSAVDRPW